MTHFYPTALVTFNDQSNPRRKGEFEVLGMTTYNGAEYVTLLGYPNPHVHPSMVTETTDSIIAREARATRAHDKRTNETKGYEAKQAGAKLKDNPNAPFTDAWKDWHYGYMTCTKHDTANLPKATTSSTKGEAKKARAEEDRRRANRK